MMNKLYILSNSPGEVSGWVKPVAAALESENLPAAAELVLLPCPYASGREETYGREIRGIDDSVSFRTVWKQKNNVQNCRNTLLQLGGDPMYGALLSAKLRAKWTIYTARPRWKSRVDHYFLPDARYLSKFEQSGINSSHVTVAGNLMIDSVPECGSVCAMKSMFGMPDSERAISFLPGSRPFEYRGGYSFFITAAMEVLSKFRGCTAFLPVAPTVDETILQKGLAESGISWSGGECVREIIWSGNGRIRLVREHQYQAIKASDLAVALPGTNNLQIAALGVPLLMVAPLNEAENIPLDGIPGIIPLSLPGAKRLKKKLVMWYSAKEKYVSLPNRISGKDIVPEYRGIMTPHMVADLVSDLLSSPEKTGKIKEGYSSFLSFERGAAKKIVQKLTEYF